MRKGDWMQTFTGRQYWPLDPRADEVHLEDIAHHLSMICRYLGACERFYSVAEHSVYVSTLVPKELRYKALFHDAAEAYCHDIIRPIKRNLNEYKAIEQINHEAICARFSIDPTEERIIKLADNAMILAEAKFLMKSPPVPWREKPNDLPEQMLLEAYAILETRMTYHVMPDTAEKLFLAHAE